MSRSTPVNTYIGQHRDTRPSVTDTADGFAVHRANGMDHVVPDWQEWDRDLNYPTVWPGQST